MGGQVPGKNWGSPRLLCCDSFSLWRDHKLRWPEGQWWRPCPISWSSSALAYHFSPHLLFLGGWGSTDQASEWAAQLLSWLRQLARERASLPSLGNGRVCMPTHTPPSCPFLHWVAPTINPALLGSPSLGPIQNKVQGILQQRRSCQLSGWMDYG